MMDSDYIFSIKIVFVDNTELEIEISRRASTYQIATTKIKMEIEKMAMEGFYENYKDGNIYTFHSPFSIKTIEVIKCYEKKY
jgi:hypothetical protein